MEIEKMEDKSRETIWGIHPKYRGWFYGSALALLTLFPDHKSWVEKLNVVGYGVVATVATIWFLFQTEVKPGDLAETKGERNTGLCRRQSWIQKKCGGLRRS